MADKDQGNLRKRLIPGHRPSLDDKPDPEHAKLASELAETVGKTIEKAAELGLGLVEDVGLKIMEGLSPSKPAAGARVMGTAASLLSRTRATVPAVSGRVANKLTGAVVGGGFEILRTLQQAVRNPRRPG